MVIKLKPAPISFQLVRWATSSPSQAPFPAQSARPTAEPARKDRLHVNAAVAFIGQPGTPTPLPAQVSFVSLFVYARFSERRSRGLRGHLLLTLTVGTETYENSFYDYNVKAIFKIKILSFYLLPLCTFCPPHVVTFLPLHQTVQCFCHIAASYIS